jgi:hypothetical protein
MSRLLRFAASQKKIDLVATWCVVVMLFAVPLTVAIIIGISRK